MKKVIVDRVAPVRILMLVEMKDFSRALRVYDRSIEILDRLVHKQGREDLHGDDAWILLHRAAAMARDNQLDEARRLADFAMPIIRSEAERLKRADLHGVLAWIETVLKPLLR